MTVLELDLSDKANPPPDDAVKAPHGWMWDRPGKKWRPRKAAAKGGWTSRGSMRNGKVAESHEPGMAPDGHYFEGTKYEDPEPSYMSAPAPKVPKAPPRVTKAVKDDMSAAVGMVGMLILPVVQAKDPYCGGVLTERFQDIVDAVLPLLCKSSAVVEFFTGESGDWMLWFKLAIALSPVAFAVGRHHILKTVEIVQDEESGELYATPRDMSEYSTQVA